MPGINQDARIDLPNSCPGLLTGVSFLNPFRRMKKTI